MGEHEVTVATCATETEARMLAELLRATGIQAALVPLASGAAGLGPTVWRPFALRVLSGDAARAKAILDDLVYGEEGIAGGEDIG